MSWREGGFSGVECIAEMMDFLREAVHAYRSIRKEDLHLVLLQRGERILPELTEGLGKFAYELLMKRGVDIQLSTGLKAVSADAVVIEDVKTKQIRVIKTRTTVATVPQGRIHYWCRCRCRRTGANQGGQRDGSIGQPASLGAR